MISSSSPEDFVNPFDSERIKDKNIFWALTVQLILVKLSVQKTDRHWLEGHKNQYTESQLTEKLIGE